MTNKWAVLSTTVKHFVNGFYSGCLIEKPWDFDVTNKDMPAFTDKVRIIKKTTGIGTVA